MTVLTTDRAPHEATRREMADRGKKLVHESYTWPQIAQAMIAAYQRAIDE